MMMLFIIFSIFLLLIFSQDRFEALLSNRDFLLTQKELYLNYALGRNRNVVLGRLFPEYKMICVISPGVSPISYAKNKNYTNNNIIIHGIGPLMLNISTHWHAILFDENKIYILSIDNRIFPIEETSKCGKNIEIYRDKENDDNFRVREVSYVF
ncbi:MAG: hypothetical protein WAT37_13215 [Saprospiraceae bacterium]|jgi:hypothetical protein